MVKQKECKMAINTVKKTMRTLEEENNGEEKILNILVQH